MRGAWLLFVLAVALLAGCLGEAPEDPGAEDEVPQQGGSQSLLEANASESSWVERVNETTYRFAWNTTRPLGDTVVQAQLAFPEPTTCTKESVLAGEARVNDWPVRRTFFLRDGEVRGWAGGSTTASHVHAASTDTRTESDDSARWAARSAFGGPEEEPVAMVVAGQGLTAWDNGLAGNLSLGLSVTCEDRFTVEQVQASHELMLFDARSLSGGAGASIGPLAETTMSDRFEADYVSPRVHVAAAGFDTTSASVTELAITTPEEEHTWRFAGAPGGSGSFGPTLSGPPGTYELDQRRLAAGQGSAYWGAVYGLSPVDHWDELEP